MPSYRAIKGVEVAGALYAPGDVIADLPKLSADWLLGKGAIEPAEGEPVKAAKTKKGA